MRNEIVKLTALEIADAIKAKKLSVREVTTTFLDFIEKNNCQPKTFLTVSKKEALQRAEEIQSRIDKGEALSLLAGVPVALKDNISAMGIETTCASKMLTGYKPVFDAAVVENLERAGLIIIGKLNMDEFAAGGTETLETSAIAKSEVPLAIGTDSGGSLRQSCSFNGITGIKPTYGSVSRFGIIASVSSMEQAGPAGKNIEDCTALLSIISGPDNRDSTCIIKKPFEFDTTDTQNSNLKNIKIGLPQNYLDGSITNIDPDIKTAILAAAKEFEASGAIIEEFEMPLAEYIIPAFSIIEAAEISSNLAKFDGLKFGYRSPNVKTLSDVYRLSRNEGFGSEVKRKIMLGSLVLSSDYYDTYYRKALQARTLIKDAYNKLFEKFDMILSPVTPTSAYQTGQNNNDPMKMYKKNIFTASANLAGLPAIALPCGLNNQGHPIGLQLIGNSFSESKLINVAKIYQNCTNHHKKKQETNTYE